MMSQSKRLSLTVFALILIGASFTFGLLVGRSNNRPAVELVTEVYNKETGKPEKVDFSQFWEAWNVLKEKYAGDSAFTDQALVYGAVEGMVKAVGDPYTVFFPPKEKELFESEVKGHFEGIGAEIGLRKEILTVIAPLKDSPAERAGLKAGDKILKIDDTITSDMSVEDAVSLIRGEHGTIVKLTILRDGENDARVIEIARDVIRVPVIDTEQKDGGVFVIKLHSFSEDSPYEFRKALQQMFRSGNKRLVFDLRNNPGGYLEAGVDIASWFLKEGDLVVKEDFGEGKETTYRSKGYEALLHTPTVILLNEGSASASEIVAGALRDVRAIPIVGKKSFGKGSVQELVDLTDKTSLKVTIARWLTPSGKSISKEGISPDVDVDFTREDAEAGKDPQLEKAIELVRTLPIN